MQAPARSISLAVWLNCSRSKISSFRAFSSSPSSSSHSNQSRGGLPRFYSEILPPSKGSVVRVNGDEFWHMTRVLRLNVNDRVELFNGNGSLVEGCIQEIGPSGLNFVALENPKSVSLLETQWHVFAAFGTLKGGRADWLVEKCTELGAHSITPLLTERSPLVSGNRVERLLRVSLAATKQCQRLHKMSFNPPMKVTELLPHVKRSTLSFIALAEAMPVFSALNSRRKESTGLLIIGPEGDFTEEERKMIVEAGATAVGLGPQRLRVETVTVALLATLMFWSDDRLCLADNNS